MAHSQKTISNGPFSLSSLIILFAVISSPALAATVAVESSSAWIWNLLIAVLALAVALGSAVLPISALKHWSGSWRYCAWFPLIILLLWIISIALSVFGGNLGSRLWALELFIWAMFTMVFMVSGMTIKRIFEKKDLEDSQTD